MFARIAFLAAVAAATLAVFASPLGESLTPARLAASREALAGLVEARPFLSAAAFVLLCLMLSALCFPAAPILGIAAGALFGFWTGLAIAAAAFTIGSTLSFLASRHLFRASVHARLGVRLGAIERGFASHGCAYLLALRINPLIPYWLVNLLMGLTAMRPRTYLALTALGLLPALAIYANAGAQLAAAGSVGDIVAPEILLSLFILSLVPLAAERLRIRPGTVIA